MSFLTNNWLLALLLAFLLALAILLIIYLIKPNYQQKYVSSTYIWQLSLRYKRKKIPINRLRNILIIICQVLILASCAFIIARPAIQTVEDVTVPEIVIVMDASASMRTKDGDGVSRIDRAVEEAYSNGYNTLQDGGIVSVIQCGNGSELVLNRVTGMGAAPRLLETLENIAENGCTYASTDLNDALSLCEERILNVNPDAEIYVYTDEIYNSTPEGVHVEYIADESSEWNAAILNAYTEKVDGYYILFVEFMTYGYNSATALNFEITIKNPNGTYGEEDPANTDKYYTIGDEIICDGEGVMTYMLMYDETYESTYSAIIGGMDDYKVNALPDYKVYYYEEIEISLASDTDDSYDLDNVYYVYGGQPQVLRVLYTTENEGTNVYLPAILSTVQNMYVDVYDVIVTYRYVDGYVITDTQEGYDFYIYERVTPEYLPTDGAVFLFDPQVAPVDAGFSIMDTYLNVDANYECYMYATEDADGNPLMNNITAGDLYLTKASLLDGYQGEYTSLMEFTCSKGTYPSLMYKDDGASKVVVMPFSVNYSNFALDVAFPVFFSNLFSYFFPTVIDGSDFSVGDTIEVTTAGYAFELWRSYNEVWGQYWGQSGTDERLFRIEAADGEDGYIFTIPEEYEYDDVSLPLTFEVLKPGRYILLSESYFYDYSNTSANKSTQISIFVHADMSESDIFSYGTALTSPYKEKDIYDFYDDLLLYFAIALAALVFIEWILHMLEGI